MKSDRHLSTWIILAFLLVFFSVFLIYPISLMLRRAFGMGGHFTVQYFVDLFASPILRQALWNSFLIAAITTALTTVISLPLAYLMTRFGFRGKSVLYGLLLLPLIMPPFVGAIGLTQLFARFGSVNLLLMQLGLVPSNRPVDWLGNGGFWGIIALQVLNLYPIMFLNVSAALASLDPALREAAQNLGAKGWRLFRTVTLPLIMPGYFAGAAIVFIWAFTDLGTPLLFDYSRVVPVQIFDSITELNTNPMGYALVVVVLLITLVLFLGSKALLSRGSYEVGGGHGSTRSVETPASPLQALGVCLFGLSIVFVAVLPQLVVVVESISADWFLSVLPSRWTLANFGELFGHQLTVSSIHKSLLYSCLSATVDLILGVLIAWLLTRRRIPFAWALESLAMLPLALPGLVLAFGYVAGFDFKLPWLNPRSNPTLLLVVSYSVRRLPYIVRAACAGFQQTSITLEDAAANLGAGPLRSLRTITLPLVMGHLIAGTILTFALAMVEVSDGLILAMREQYYPITKMIWQILGRIDPHASGVACALGVVAMAILAACLFISSRLLGRKMGQLFRA